MIIKANSFIGMHTRIEKSFSFFIIILPFLYQFKSFTSTISLGETALLPFIVYFFLIDIKKEKKEIDLKLLLFYISTILSTAICMLFAYFRIADAATVFIRLVFYGLLINFAREHFNYKFAETLYISLVFVFSIYLIIQYFYYYAVGGYLPIYLRYEWIFPPEARAKSLDFHFRFYYRSSSLFLEPSYFSLFSLPGFCILLLKNKKNLFEKCALLIVCSALVLSTSSSAIAGIGIAMIIYTFKRTEQKEFKDMFIRFIVVLITVSTVLIYILVSENSATLVRRLQTGGSFNQRIGRGFILYRDMNLIHKLIGVGINNLEPYMNHYNLATPFDERNLNYSSSMMQTLTYSGIFGFAFLFNYFVGLKKKAKDNITNALFWIVIFMLSYESILYSYRFGFLIILLEANKNQKDDFIEQKDILA